MKSVPGQVAKMSPSKLACMAAARRVNCCLTHSSAPARAYQSSPLALCRFIVWKSGGSSKEVRSCALAPETGLRCPQRRNVTECAMFSWSNDIYVNQTRFT